MHHALSPSPQPPTSTSAASPDTPELVLLLVDDPRRFRRAALRWHSRYCGEVPDVGFEEAHAVLSCLAGLAGRRPKPAALAELVH